jgi:hypothetical protein
MHRRLSFLAPLGLLGLLALPALWWLLRATPPQPATTPLPAAAFAGPAHQCRGNAGQDALVAVGPAPALLTLLILAFAGPIWRASGPDCPAR